MEIKQYSNNGIQQSCYAKTIKRMENDATKFGDNDVLDHISTNYYWWRYENPKETDTYYDLIRKQLSRDEAFAAIQQAQIDFANHLRSKEKEVTEEDKLTAKREFWKGMVSGIWYFVVNSGIDIKAFNSFPVQYGNKSIKMGDMEAWGYKPSEIPEQIIYCLKCLNHTIKKALNIDNPCRTKIYYDENKNLIRINEIYIPYEQVSNYVVEGRGKDWVNREWIYKTFGAPEDNETPDFLDDPLALKEDEI